MQLDCLTRSLFRLALLLFLEHSLRKLSSSQVKCSYIVEKKGKLCYLIPGVCFNILAVASNTVTYHFLSKDQKAGETASNLLESGEVPAKVSTKIGVWKLVGICLVGGIFLHLLSAALLAMFWGPSTAIAGQSPFPLNPYVCLILSFE